MRVVLIVIDATRTPNIWRQVQTGGRAPEGGVSLPMSVTYANHAAFVTGVDPSISGVYGNHAWIDGEGWVKAPKAGPRATTLFDRVKAAGGRSVIVVGDHKLIGQMGGASADESWPPNGWIPEGTARCEFGYPADAAVVEAARQIGLDADFVVLHLNQPDTTSHLYGPDSPEALAQYAATDAAYGELIGLLDDGWDHTVVITLSDHDQETVTDHTSVPVVEALAPFGELSVVGEGTAALIHGSLDDVSLGFALGVPGVGGVERLSDDVWMVWTVPGRVFDESAIPLGGQHGSPRCRTQLAVVSGGHDRVPELCEWVSRSRPSALDWAPMIADLLGLGDESAEPAADIAMAADAGATS